MILTTKEQLLEGWQMGYREYDTIGPNGVKIIRQDLSGICLGDGGSFAHGDFSYSNLSGCDLKKKKGISPYQARRQGFVYCNFTGCDLRNADLRGAFLYGANFTDADLRGANFEGADLECATFKNTKTDGAKFKKALLFRIKGDAFDCYKGCVVYREIGDILLLKHWQEGHYAHINKTPKQWCRWAKKTYPSWPDFMQKEYGDYMVKCLIELCEQQKSQ